MITDAGAPITFEAAVPQFSVPDVVRTAEYGNGLILAFGEDTSQHTA